VTRGEKHHIFPFQENSDAIFNSALIHELAVLRPLAEPLLLQVRHDAPSTPRPTACCRSCSGSYPPRPIPCPTTRSSASHRRFDHGHGEALAPAGRAVGAGRGMNLGASTAEE